MQIMLDIPDAAYEQFKRQAERQQRSVEDVVLSNTLRFYADDNADGNWKGRYPLIRSAHPASLDPEAIAEFDPFDPD